MMNPTNNESFSTILDLVWNRRFSNKSVLYFYKNFKCYDRWTSSQIWLAAQRISEHLGGIAAETPVLISLPNGPEFVAAFFSCHMQRLWPAPIVSPDIWNRADYLEYVRQIVERNGIKHIFCSSDVAKDIEAMGLVALKVDDCWKKSNLNDYELKAPARSSSPKDIALLQFSSGSTSDSKGVLLSHERILRNLAQMTKGMNSFPSDALSAWLPMYHDMGLIGGVLEPVFLHSELHSSTPIDFITNPAGWLKHLSDVGATAIVGPDFMYKLLARKAKDLKETLDLSKLRICMTGAEPVLAETCREFIEAVAPHKFNPKSLMPVYGMAEAVLGIAFTAPLQGFRYQLIEGMPTEWVSCGRPLEDVKIQIRGANGEVLPEKEIGEIYIHTPTITLGFYKRDDLNQELFKDGWYQTGDTGFLSDGELFITGRVKDLIIIRGRKIYSVDIESRLQDKWKNEFSRVAVVTASDATDNKTVIVAIEVRSWLRTGVSKKTVTHFLKSNYPAIDFNIYFVPRKSLPRTSSGKLKRYKIREMAKTGGLDQLAEQGLKLVISNSLKNTQQLFQVLKSKFRKNSNLKVENVPGDSGASRAVSKQRKVD